MSDPLNINIQRAQTKKVVFFVMVVILMVAVYQIISFYFILPNMPISWRRGNLELLKDFEEKKVRLTALVMLEEDSNPDIPHQLQLFDDPAVRMELNRLRGSRMLVLIDPKNDEHREWLQSQPQMRLPSLVLYASGYDPPIAVYCNDYTPEQMAKLLNDVRFQRYER